VQRDSSAPLPAVEIGALSDALLRVTVDGVTATLTSHSVEVTGMSMPPMTVGVRVETEADAIAAELRTLSRDAALVATLEVLIETFGP
jgi:hypothetical protein